MENLFKFEVLPLQICAVDDSTKLSLATDTAEIAKARKIAALESASELKRKVAEFQGEVVKNLRERCYEAYASLTEKLSTGEFNQKSITSVKRLLESFKDMNFMNDKDLDSFVDEELRKMELTSAKDMKDNKGMFDGFVTYTQQRIEVIKELMEDDSSAQAVVDAFIGQSGKMIDIGPEPEADPF
jgi:hypothetical protein